MTRRLSSARRCPAVGSFLRLEDRTVPAVFSVTNLNDNGAGSLRAAIVSANADQTADIIRFADNLQNGTISLTGIAHTPEGGSALLVTSPITIIGNGETITRPANTTSYRLFRVAVGASLTLRDLTLRGGSVLGGRDTGGLTGDGGAIINLGTLVTADTDFINNTSTGSGAGLGIGGAIYNATGATASVSRGLFQNNQAVSGLAAIGAAGGAIASDGTLNIFACTFAGNEADIAVGNAVGQGRGGAVASFAVGNIFNSTFNGNAARSNGTLAVGGGVYNTGTTGLSFCTLAGNIASSTPASNGQGGAAANRGTLTLENSIFWASVAGSDVYNFQEAGPPVLNVTTPNIIGTLTSVGGVVNGLGPISTDPLLGPLQDNGGRTPTMALLQNSPALNFGTFNGAQVVAVDERGLARATVAPDLGAYEVQHPLSPVGVPADFITLFGPQPSATATVAFVKGLYQATLLRAGSDAEVTFYVNKLTGGTLTRGQAARNFYNSPENRGRQVNFFYSYFLNRSPSQTELNFYIQQLQNGVDEGAVMANFILSPEFTGQNNNPQFVNTMYYAILGRAASVNEVSFYVNKLDNHNETRQDVLNNFLRSPEGIGRVVRSDYIAYLKRQPTTAELNAVTGPIQAGTMTFGSVAIGILGGAEFFADAGNNL